MGGIGSGCPGSRRSKFRPAYAPPLYRPQEARQQPPKPLEYKLVDLLGEEGIGEDSVEAIRVLLMFVAARRRTKEEAAREDELEGLRLELGEHVATEARYEDALRRISNAIGEPTEIAAEALYGDKDLVGLPVANGDAPQAQPQGGDA